MQKSRFIIGIDLGTTNSAVTFVDTESENKGIQLFKVPHFSAQGELEEFILFPSFCFFPDKKTTNFRSMRFPWEKHGGDCFFGVFARDFGATVPNRFVCSAKSWLCHSGVDRRGKILPWGGSDKEILSSPLEITSHYLEHIKNAWNYRLGKLKDKSGSKCLFTEQSVVITIPASFDETARELTIEAAKNAGYKNINLLEEPLAAFYSWIDQNSSTWKDNIKDNERVLVIDIGGGTSDFSIIEKTESGSLVRSAAGTHLLLGGDNIDIAIARKVETFWNITLSHGEWLTLCQKTRQAKEELLSSDLNEIDIVLLSHGSSIIGNSKRYSLKKNELESLLLEGFFPLIPADSPAPAKKTAIQKMGLPYEPDPSVSGHLLYFLKYAYRVCENKNDKDSKTYQVLFPDKVLFNGGAMIPAILRNRILKMLRTWFNNENVFELDSRDLSLAVSYGASYYGRTKRGDGVKVKTGTNRSYYLKIADKGAEKHKEKLLCVMPRGIDESVKIETPGSFKIETNKAVAFPLYSSSVRINDKAGDFINENEEMSFVSSLKSLLKYGKNHERKELRSEVVSDFTETGILKVSLKSLDSDHVWPLSFDIRLISSDLEESTVTSDVVVDYALVSKCKRILNSFFCGYNKNGNIFREMEEILDLSKDCWPLHLIRSFVDELLKVNYKELISPEKEARFLNICGFCLRPGFGEPEDEIRLRKVWAIWYNGMNNPNNSQVAAEWWVFWRRVVSGLKAGHQIAIFQELNKQIVPKGVYQSKIKIGLQPKIEMWRCLGALELLPENQKILTAEILISRSRKLESYEYWVLSRIGARKLLHAQSNNAVNPKPVEKWVKNLLDNMDKSNLAEKYFCLSKLAALTQDRALNLGQGIINESLKFLKENNAPSHWIAHLESVQEDDSQELTKTLGDSIPLGLFLN